MRTALSAPVSELLSTREAAAVLGVAEQTLRIWRCKKTHPIPCVKYSTGKGGAVRYRRADLERFVDANTSTPVVLA